MDVKKEFTVIVGHLIGVLDLLETNDPTAGEKLASIINHIAKLMARDEK